MREKRSTLQCRVMYSYDCCSQELGRVSGHRFEMEMICMDFWCHSSSPFSPLITIGQESRRGESQIKTTIGKDRVGLGSSFGLGRRLMLVDLPC